MQLRFVVSLIFAILVALFAIVNSGVVIINFLFAEYPVSQALVILISATLGAIIVMLLGAVKQYKLQRKNKEQGKIVEEKEKLIEEKEKLVGEKEKLIEEKENTIGLLQNEITELKKQNEQSALPEKEDIDLSKNENQNNL
jgi:uncharacterized integral membrane protein